MLSIDILTSILQLTMILQYPYQSINLLILISEK